MLTPRSSGTAASTDVEQFDHTSDPSFFAYYERESVSPAALARFRSIQTKVIALLRSRGLRSEGLRVVDIGCGPGTQALLWAELGHDVQGLDVNTAFIEIATKRAAERGLGVRFDVGSATALPYADASVDVCLVPELLEHVVEWERCLNEMVRVLATGGVLYLSTTNALCPVQQEFNLPLYSWYPAFVKRRYERLAVTTKPEIANYATYPAVNWFTYYQLRDYLGAFGFECLDRFAMVDPSRMGAVTRTVVELTRSLPPLRFLAHVLTEGTAIFAIKRVGSRR